MTYRFGSFALLPEARRLERDGQPVALTPRALDLLIALVRHRSRALSKDEILTMVWPDAVVEEGNIAQQVLLLRRALDDEGRIIATLPRHGYQFVAAVIEQAEAAASLASPHCLVWDGREFPLPEGVTVIGRAEDADLRIPLPSLSRRHARVTVEGPDAVVADLGSRHGTWRGGVKVTADTALRSGDELRLGTAVLTYLTVMPADTTRG